MLSQGSLFSDPRVREVKSMQAKFERQDVTVREALILGRGLPDPVRLSVYGRIVAMTVGPELVTHTKTKAGLQVGFIGEPPDGQDPAALGQRTFYKVEVDVSLDLVTVVVCEIPDDRIRNVPRRESGF